MYGNINIFPMVAILNVCVARRTIKFVYMQKITQAWKFQF